QFKEENPIPNVYGSKVSVCSSRIKNDPNSQNPDPNIIHMIAKTLIGDYLWKYTRNNFWSRKRHRRFFWIHPYTNILYWSKENPATYEFDSPNLKKKVSYFTYIDYVHEIINDDYSSPDLYHTSLVITTPEGDMEITTQSKEQHECWFQALRYLHRRSGLNQIPTSLSVELLNNDSDYFCDDDGDSDDLKNMRQCCNGRHDISKLERFNFYKEFGSFVFIKVSILQVSAPFVDESYSSDQDLYDALINTFFPIAFVFLFSVKEKPNSIRNTLLPLLDDLLYNFITWGIPLI
ncbi:31236_t:CDS:2, partial [Racocetra persica]